MAVAFEVIALKAKASEAHASQTMCERVFEQISTVQPTPTPRKNSSWMRESLEQELAAIRASNLPNLQKLQQTYLALKREEYTFGIDYTMQGARRELLDRVMQQEIIDRFNGAFEVEGKSERFITQFYINRIRAKYIQTANQIYAQIAREYFSHIADSAQQIALREFLHRSHGYFNSLYQNSISPERVVAIFRDIDSKLVTDATTDAMPPLVSEFAQQLSCQKADHWDRLANNREFESCCVTGRCLTCSRNSGSLRQPKDSCR